LLRPYISCAKEVGIGNSWSWYHYDARGSVTHLTNASGQVVEQYSYSAFGIPSYYSSTGQLLNSSTVGNRFLFQGRDWIKELSLYDFRNRINHPGIGRFLQPDPLNLAAGDQNIYRFCNNDPINGSDPLGFGDDSSFGFDFSNGLSGWGYSAANEAFMNEVFASSSSSSSSWQLFGGSWTLILHMVRGVIGVLLIGGLLLLCSCTKQCSDVITIEEMLHSYGNPVVIGSGFDIEVDSSLSPPVKTVTFYGITQKVSADSIKNLSPGQIVAYCDNPRFADWVDVHFADMHDPRSYTGETLFSGTSVNEYNLTIFRITDAKRVQVEYSNFVTRVYLEVGAKGNVKLVRPVSSQP
jgi:RHS repeat-associated protein